MGATNRTTNSKLPQFVASDKPSWLGDFNDSMLKIEGEFVDVRLHASTTDANLMALLTRVAALESKVH